MTGHYAPGPPGLSDMVPGGTALAWYTKGVTGGDRGPGAPDLSSHPAVYKHLRGLVVSGESESALVESRRIARTATDPTVIAQALTYELIALINLAEPAAYGPRIDAAFTTLNRRWEPTIAGELHTLAGWIALRSGSVERCVRHLVYGERALGSAPLSLGVVDGWHDLGLTLSAAGLHDQALAAADRSAAAGRQIGLPAAQLDATQIRVRHALALDHHGDTLGCRMRLQAIVDGFQRRRAAGQLPLWPVEQGFVAYAAARLSATGGAVDFDYDGALAARADEADDRVLRAYTPVCQAIAAGAGQDALDLLRTAPTGRGTLGAAEPHRLAALAHATAGQLPAALSAEREATRVVSGQLRRLSTLFIEGVAARIDHEQLRHVAARYADDALTDPLTGLPNRRHLDQYVTELLSRAVTASLGVLDMDRLKVVNDLHGHLAGDLVLERLAALLARTVRRDDFVARYGGDEFVLVLPETDLIDAEEIGRRILEAVSAEDWGSLVPDATPSVSLGWSMLDATGMAAAFVAADRAMYAMKRRVPAG